ncbi:MAG: glycosyltransferase family 2 protein [Burkholderiaceae bacterium]
MGPLSVALTVALVVAAVPSAIALAVFALQVLLAVTSPARAAVPAGRTMRPRLAVLVPAHDEAQGIAPTIAAIAAQLHAGDRLLVVADNCRDATADVARAAGAAVVERHHETERGKGFALAFGVDALRADPPQLVVIVDADCELAPGALDALAARTTATGRPSQACYLMLHPAGATLPRRLAQFAWRVRNLVRPLGWQRIGAPCQLMGSGMCLRWETLRDAALADAAIVEDMKLGLELALRGEAPVFCPEAVVTSAFPGTEAASRTQRTRWEHGHLQMIASMAPALLRRALARRDLPLLGLALDLCVPPLALLQTMLFALLCATAALAAVAPRAAWPCAAMAFAGLLNLVFVATVLVAWRGFGRDLVSLAELAAVPLYVVRKLPMYARFLTHRQRHWVRTGRDEP